MTKWIWAIVIHLFESWQIPLSLNVSLYIVRSKEYQYTTKFSNLEIQLNRTDINLIIYYLNSFILFRGILLMVIWDIKWSYEQKGDFMIQRQKH